MQRLFKCSEHPPWEIRGTGTHILCWNMQRLFEWSGYPSWEIRDTGLTCYIGTCKGCLSDQDILPEKSEALVDLHAMYVGICKDCLSDQDISPKKSEVLDWHPMLVQRLFEWSGYPSWEIRGTGLTCYIGTCKGCLSDQDIPSEKSEALDSHTMLEHAKVVWVIRTSLLRNHRHWTHPLCWDMQRLFE